MDRSEVVGVAVLAIVALTIGFTALMRFHDGRCRAGGNRGGLDCTYPAHANDRSKSWGTSARR